MSRRGWLRREYRKLRQGFDRVEAENIRQLNDGLHRNEPFRRGFVCALELLYGPHLEPLTVLEAAELWESYNEFLKRPRETCPMSPQLRSCTTG